MSFHKINSMPVQPNEPRDYLYVLESNAAYSQDLWNDNRVIGLDWAVFNRGAAVVTFTINGTYSITIPAGAFRSMDNTKFALVSITATDVYTLMIAGVRRG